MHFFYKSYRISLHSLHKYNYVIFDFFIETIRTIHSDNLNNSSR